MVNLGDPAAVADLVGVVEAAIDRTEPGLLVRTRADVDQVVAHLRAAGWSDLRIGACVAVTLARSLDSDVEILLADAFTLSWSALD